MESLVSTGSTHNNDKLLWYLYAYMAHSRANDAFDKERYR
jgi:hypothetical protein